MAVRLWLAQMVGGLALIAAKIWGTGSAVGGITKRAGPAMTRPIGDVVANRSALFRLSDGGPTRIAFEGVVLPIGADLELPVCSGETFNVRRWWFWARLEICESSKGTRAVGGLRFDDAVRLVGAVRKRAEYFVLEPSGELTQPGNQRNFFGAGDRVPPSGVTSKAR